jgi:hypothetical protein
LTFSTGVVLTPRTTSARPRQSALVVHVAVAVSSNASVRNCASAPVAGLLKLPSAPAVSVQFVRGVVASFARCSQNDSSTCSLVTSGRSLSVTVPVVPVPVAVSMVAPKALIAGSSTSQPVISKQMIALPVGVPPKVATSATLEGEAPAFATQIDMMWVVLSVAVGMVTLL